MTCRAGLRLSFGSPAEAQGLAASLAPENDGFLETRVEGDVLVAEASAESPLALLRTLDDALSCLSAAQKAARAGRP